MPWTEITAVIAILAAFVGFVLDIQSIAKIVQAIYYFFAILFFTVLFLRLSKYFKGQR